MWVNAMLTVWLWGTIASLVLIALSLWKWYLPKSYQSDDRADPK